MPEPVQVGSGGRSLHYLFRLPDGVEPGVHIKHSADGKPEEHMDIKTGNQVMHLKLSKQLLDLPPVDELPIAPESLLKELRKDEKRYVGGGVGGKALQDAVSEIRRGGALHGNALTISSHMLLAGQSEVEVRLFFDRLREDIENTRGEDRAAHFFNGELTDMIKGMIQPPAEVPFVAEENAWDDWVYVAHDDRFRRLSTNAALKPAAFNSFMAREDTWLTEKKKLTPVKWALEVAQIPTVQFSMYAPQFGRFFNYEGDSCVNTYRPDSAPKAADSFSNVYQKHVEMMFPNDYKVVSQWLAWVVRNPGRKVLWALVFKGIEGDGKSLIARMAKAAMGVSNTKEISMAELNSEFTGWSSGHCLGVIEEVRVKGQNRHKVMDKLKPYITNPEINVIRKGVDGQTALNTVNYMLLTNHEDALAISEGDRRYGVFFTPFTDRDQLPSTEHYYIPLAEAINDHPDQVRAWLESIDLSDFNPSVAPAMTEAKRSMIRQSQSDSVATLAEALELGGVGVHKLVFSTSAVNRLIKELELGSTLNSTTLSNAAVQLGYEKVDHPIKYQGVATRAYRKKGYGRDLDNAKIRELWDSYTQFDSE